MNRRLIVGILLLALAWQGPVMAYSAALAPITTTSGAMPCTGDLLPNGHTCDDCCSHSSGHCGIPCAFSLSAATPAVLAGVAVTVPRLPAPDADRPLLVERHPARLLRPPIV
jgi:hypothetical protein